MNLWCKKERERNREKERNRIYIEKEREKEKGGWVEEGKKEGAWHAYQEAKQHHIYIGIFQYDNVTRCNQRYYNTILVYVHGVNMGSWYYGFVPGVKETGRS